MATRKPEWPLTAPEPVRRAIAGLLELTAVGVLFLGFILVFGISQYDEIKELDDYRPSLFTPVLDALDDGAARMGRVTWTAMGLTCVMAIFVALALLAARVERRRSAR